MLLALVSAASVLGQEIYLERQVIGGSRMDAVHEGVRFSGTMGEVITATGEVDSEHAITQGFHQSKMSGPLRIEVEITPATCRSKKDGSITIENISGCKEPYGIRWASGDTAMTIDNLGAGDYIITVESEFCTRDFEFSLPELERPCPLVFYNVITPDDDGKNDYWHIEDITLPYYQNNSVSIFNRWGREVWKEEGYDNSTTLWRGQDLNDRNLPAGTYYYQVTAGGESYKGYVEVIR